MQILAIDQGTTSSRAIVFDRDLRPVASAQAEFTQHFPASGWIEHDAEEIWQSVLSTCRGALDEAGPVDALGITNQRETVLAWDRATGQPLYRALVWQDRRTAKACAKLRAEGVEPMVTGRTGLLLDPYFTATKAGWLMENIPEVQAAAKAGTLALGTVDAFLIWRLTGGRVFATDATNAARTMLYDIREGAWDPELCKLFDVPIETLPEVRDCNADFGATDPAHFGTAIPILGVAGDQQAATIGQACFEPGMLKSTYGTGCFALLNTGAQMVPSHNRLLTTIAYRLDGQVTYALEGSIFIAGAVVQWLRDGLKIIKAAPDTQALADAADPGQEVIVVPAFTGLGAPWWQPDCRGAVYGLTRNSGPEELARAALESVGFQTADLHSAMLDDWARSGAHAAAGVLRVDGGMSASDYAMQFLADVLGAAVDRPQVLETTALGAAWLAGSKAGICGDRAAFAASWALERQFTPTMPAETRKARRTAWSRAVQATMLAAGVTPQA